MPIAKYTHAPEFAERYKDVLRDFGASPELTAWAAFYAEGHAGRCEWDAQFIGKPSVKRCLNIGGSPYIFEFALKKMFPHIDITTIDVHPERFPNAADVIGMRVICADIEADSAPITEKFDLIVFAEIFEHLRIDILGTMARVRDLLTDDGKIYLTMPNGLGFNAWRRRLLKGRTGPSLVEEWSKLSKLGHMGHVREYSMSEVTEVLTHCGFVIEKSLFRSECTHPWPKRDFLLKLRPAFGDEVLIVARKE